MTLNHNLTPTSMSYVSYAYILLCVSYSAIGSITYLQ